MANQATSHTKLFPPVVAVLGHVDHGKTTLLDAIRDTSIAEREHGGITQKIGASSIEVMHEGSKRAIAFIDTPGHEAFAQMRSRGAYAADIGLLIVSSVDGVMPQTRESIKVLQGSKIPFIVVLTKSDLPTKNPEKVKGQVLREGVMLEGMGGDVPVIEVASKTKKNIKELLDLILLVQELSNADSSTVSPSHPLRAIVIESRLDQKAGPRATVVVKDGTIKVRQDAYCDNQQFRIRSLMNDNGASLQDATIGAAVEILGFLNVPAVGSTITDVVNVEVKTVQEQIPKAVYSPAADQTELPVILLADSQGSLEAIKYSLPEKVKLLEQKTGEVTESDIMHAKSTGALVIGFNSKIRPDVAKLARTEKVLCKNYTIIYELLSELADVMEGKALSLIEEIYGTAKILAKFPFEKTFVLGIGVVDGRIARGDKIRIVRGDNLIGEAQINSLRIGKNPINKVEKGNEAGIIITPELDFEVGDMVISHE
ncbi:MAG: GTP-binding protein [Candidatus Levybacteria bacterium]|nr:GTP-binding protein [Candidatus Levybacteria bacterium]